MEERVIFVFDEFQRLIEVYKGALSLLQKVWDEKLRRTKKYLHDFLKGGILLLPRG
ncbi:MAG: hypothetical protein ACTSVA_03130 [Candidatus Njordarchaeales archaeon]